MSGNRLKRRLILSTALLLAAVTVATTALFAWFANGKAYISNIEFVTGKIDMTVDLFAFRDFNRDGIPDFDDTTGEDLFDDVLNPPIGSAVGIFAENALPGQVFRYRLTAKNLSPNPVAFALSMKAETDADGVSLNDCFQFETTRDGTDYTISIAGVNVVLIDEPAEGQNRVPLVIIEAGTTLQFDFILRFSHLETLKSSTETAGLFAGKENLNDYLGRSFINCKFFFEFRQGAKNEV